MTVTDDGIGFDTTKLKTKQQTHVGLSIIQERTQKISGKMKIISAPNQGTTLELTIPM